MKKILKYISLLAGVAFLTAACSQSDIDGNASEEMGTLRLSVNIGGSRADAYNALDRSIMRVYKIENGEEKLIRKYQPATEAPGDFYLVAGSYRIKVEAGDQSQATFTNKSYYGELDVDIEPQQTVLKEVGHQHRRQSRLRSDDSGQNGSGIQGLRQRHRHLLQNGS